MKIKYIMYNYWREKKSKRTASSHPRSSLQPLRPSVHLEKPSALQSLWTGYWWAPELPSAHISPCEWGRCRPRTTSSRDCKTCQNKAAEKRKEKRKKDTVKHFLILQMHILCLESINWKQVFLYFTSTRHLPRWTVGNLCKFWWWKNRRDASRSSRLGSEVPEVEADNRKSAGEYSWREVWRQVLIFGSPFFPEEPRTW